MLRLTPTAWAKLIFLRDAGPTEIGGFGISSAKDPLLIEDIRLLRQSCDAASVLLDDEAVADYFDEQVDQGLTPERFARVWVHTHPGDSPRPSGVDEETFRRVFGLCQWAVMFILARGGRTYARLHLDAGVRAATEIEVAVDYEQPFAGSDHHAWRSEYDAHVEPITSPVTERIDSWDDFDRYHWELAGELAVSPAEAATDWDPFVESIDSTEDNNESGKGGATDDCNS